MSKPRRRRGETALDYFTRRMDAIQCLVDEMALNAKEVAELEAAADDDQAEAVAALAACREAGVR